jgi:pyrroloquinoline quinone biosynthesis protein D
MNKHEIDLNQVPTWHLGYKLQFEAAQNSYVILYPEGLIKLNESAAEIAKQINGVHSVLEIIHNIQIIFGDLPEIEQDILDYLAIAYHQHWIDLQ